MSITEEDLSNFRKLVKSKVSISIPCGVDINQYSPCPEQNTTVDLAYLASFDWLPNRQGAWWFVDEVWPLIREKCPNATFHLAGRHMSLNMKALEVPGIKIIDDVPDMAGFICKARLIVIPLLAGSGMRIKILENMALGKCQVSTTIGAEGISVTSGEDIFLADDPEEIARLVAELLDNDSLRKKVGTAARKKVEQQYDNQSLGHQLLHFYETEVC